jgi:hypothetical protein
MLMGTSMRTSWRLVVASVIPDQVIYTGPTPKFTMSDNLIYAQNVYNRHFKHSFAAIQTIKNEASGIVFSPYVA